MKLPTMTNFNSRTLNEFQFELSTNVLIPSTTDLGKLIVRFPNDYVLQESPISCSSSDN